MHGHCNDHRNEDNRIVKHVELNTRDEKLHKARRDWGPKDILVQEVLGLQKKMLEVVPELDRQRYFPPFQRAPDKTFSQKPQTHQHEQGIEIVQTFACDQPRIIMAQDAS